MGSTSVLAWRIPGMGKPGWAAVYGVTQSRTRLKRLSSSSSNTYFWLLAIFPDVSISYMVCSRHLTSSVGQRTRAAKAEAKEPAAAFCRSLEGCKHRRPVTHSLGTGRAPTRIVKQSEHRWRGTLLQRPPGAHQASSEEPTAPWG